MQMFLWENIVAGPQCIPKLLHLVQEMTGCHKPAEITSENLHRQM